jgi:two-component system heavy metal sensor histidine kinase CusS
VREGSIVARVVRATVFVAVVSALALAAVAAVTAGILWQSSERKFLADTASAVHKAAEREAAEEGTPLEVAAPEALKDLATVGCQVEIWREMRLIVIKPPGRPLGPLPAWPAADPAGWLVNVQDLGEGLRLIVAHPREHETRSLQVFGLSLLLSLPACLLLALLTGGYVARRATRPLVEFTEHIGRIQGLRQAELPPLAGRPREVRELELSFRDLLERLSRSVARELEFAANASHELRTPLTRIRLHAERVLSGAGGASRAELEAQIAEIDRMVRMVDSLLVLARDAELRIPHGEDVNLADVLREGVRRVFGEDTPPDLEVPDEAIVEGDEDLLRIAVENLLDNARKFTPPGRRVGICLGETGGVVRLAVVSPGARLKDRERAFERFYRGEDARVAHAGHGLGLSLARHIARLHGGDLTCEDEPADAVTFVLSLPPWRPGGA